MAESQQSQEASAGGAHCPKAGSVGFEDDHDQTAQGIPMNEVPENEALSPTRITDEIFSIDLANKQLRTILPGVLSLEYLEELHIEKNPIVSIPRDINCLRHMKVLYLDQNHIQDICEEQGELKCLLSLDLSNNPLSCSSLPVICNLQSLRQLRLNETNLHRIPLQICEYLHHVELLGLSDNNLKCLPKEIANLTKLKEIYLQKNRFKSFPKDLCHIANLEIIDLEQNLISLIPEQVGFLANLVKLFLAFNNLSSIPPTLQHCQKLAVLDLSHNLLHKLPPGLKNLTEMRVLRLSANILEKFPHQICCWPSLSHVYLRNTGLCTVPGSFTRLTSVSILDLSENCFDEISKGICPMKNLEVLALDGNQIQEILAEVKELSNLKCLSLSENQLSIFPKEIFLLESLERLYLGQDKGIKFTSLPEDISKLQNLKELHMENNCLEYLPAAIGSLTHLKITDCRNNLLRQLPDAPFAFVCSGLKLLVQNNHLSQLPEDLDSLQQLELVLVDGNAMTDPPTEVCCQGTSAIWEYLREKRRKRAMNLKIQSLWRGLMNQKGIGPFFTLKNLMKKRKKEKKGKGKGKEGPVKGSKAKKWYLGSKLHRALFIYKKGKCEQR
ncbi:LOW QUALITY PROTEIN: leucine-rich repeat and IQ domain-containing protein 4 [Phoenicopterus ruber ruber]